MCSSHLVVAHPGTQLKPSPRHHCVHAQSPTAHHLPVHVELGHTAVVAHVQQVQIGRASCRENCRVRCAPSPSNKPQTTPQAIGNLERMRSRASLVQPHT